MNWAIDALSSLAAAAGRRALEIYNSREYISSIAYKPDRTPVTSADLEAQEIILSGLKQMWPRIPAISEELPMSNYQGHENWRFFWLVDPIDGTEEFIKRTGDFTVNIALAEVDRPILGVIYVPVQDMLYYAYEGSSFKQSPGQRARRISVRRPEDGDLLAIVSRSHFTDTERAFIEQNDIHRCLPMTSSFKFCLIAEGRADLYYNCKRTFEWDTAAGQAILEAAGGRVLDANLRPLRYNKPTLANGPYLCEDSPSLLDRVHMPMLVL